MKGNVPIFLSGVLVSFGLSCTQLTPKPNMSVTEKNEQIEVAARESVHANAPDTLSVRSKKIPIVSPTRKGSLQSNGVMR